MKIVCISDTHGYHNGEITLPKGDVLVHTGDMSRGRGSIGQVQAFNNWLGTLDFEHIVFTPGNHDFPFERDEPLMREMMTNCHLLMEEEVVIDGVKFYGAPHQPWYHNWAFNVERGPKLAEIWSRIPDDTNVLLTHGPPYMIGDFTYYDQEHVGCEDLLNRINKLKDLKLHVFGHIHEAYGQHYFPAGGTGIFVNASTCNLQYQPVNPPVVIDI